MKSEPKELHEAAATLADLKKLAPEQKCRLLLAKLARVGNDPNALNKNNLMLPGDHYGLASGYPRVENRLVREYLLGAPWTRLVNEGYLVDATGHGFYHVTDEGREYLRRELPRQVTPDSPNMTPATMREPSAFLSYTWEGAHHQEWVAKLAERLQGEGGVKITVDRWHLTPGNDKLVFMEKAVRDNDFVIVVCTPTYAERANNREGGVGYESMVITGELAKRIQTNRFIPVLRLGTWDLSLPTYLQSRMGVNLSNEPYREQEYQMLLRTLHGEPMQSPPVGGKPKFSTSSPSTNQS